MSSEKINKRKKSVVLITGASRGIGRACAKALAERYEVITTARTGDVSIRGDLCSPDFVERLINDLEIDVLINNAGTLDEDLESTFQLNFDAARRLMVGFYEKMKLGHIINVCSTVSTKTGFYPMGKAYTWYYTSKQALYHFSKTLDESRRKPIKVSTIEPGFVDTGFAGVPISDISNEEYFNQRRRLLPMKPEDVANAISWVLDQPPYLYVKSLVLQNFIIEDISNFRN